MQKAKPWHEDDSFWETWGPLIFSPRHMENAAVEVDKVINLLEITAGAHILDLCCGVGRHSLELVRRGLRVTGVDRTKSYLDQAEKQASEESLDVEFIQDDIRTYCQPEAFDVVISMFTSFGYFEDIEDDRKVVMNVCRSLKPGGRFIIDTHGKETLARIFQERRWEEKDEVIWLQESSVTQNWSWMHGRWIMLRGNKRTEGEISHRLYAGTEMITLLTKCGFSQVHVYGNLDGISYDQNAQRLIVVGAK